MANWKETIELNPLINKLSEEHDLSIFEDDCPETVKEQLAKEIEKSTTLRHFAGRLRRCKSIAAVNRCIERVFDYADRNLVWCGM